MSRPIAHNKVSEPINGSIVNGDNVGNIVYTVDGRGNNYYDGYADRLWVPSADGAAPIVFVTDTFTQGYTGDPAEAVPLFFACAGTSSAAIIYTANRLPGMSGQNFTTIGDALEYVTRNGYFILEGNDPFEGINADSLALDLDAAKMSSYPQQSEYWYDLSGNQNIADLINGPLFQTGGWFNLDGTDDRIQRASNILTTTTGTVVMWLRTLDTTWLMIEGNTTGYYLGAIYLGGAWYNASCGSPSYYVDTNASTNPTSEGYIDGRFHMFEAKNVDLSGWTTHQFLDYGGGSTFNMTGDVAKIQMYNRSLTAAESKQNYFGSPIVTDGLIFAVDANNIVSYPKSGTAWYNLTSSLNSGSLVNGPTFSPANGGSIVFDGTDDYISTNFTQTFTDEVTVECWYRGTKSARNHLWTLGRYAGNTNLTADFNDSGITLWIYWNGGGSPAIRYTSPNFTDNTIKHLVFTHSGSVNKTYLNGELLTPYDVLGSQTFSPAVGGVMEIGSVEGTSLPFGGNVYSYRVYNKGLTAAEVLQNYQAEQYRFEGPQGPVTNGLVLYWDAGNLDSYPGTGTTIYDLSGNGNNGNLVNGVGYNQSNGGVLTFDGVDDLLYYGGLNLSSTNYTLMGAARYSGGTRGRMINSTNNNWLMGQWANSTENYYAEGWVSTPGVGASDTNWRIYSALGDVSGDSYSLYVNNSLNAGPSNGGSAGPNGISVGAQGYSSEYSTGEFGFVLAYNRILTAAEMTQNYNYFKGRYGL